MTLGTWTPDNDRPTPPGTAVLQAAARLGRGEPDRFPESPDAGLTVLQPWMRQSRQAWQPVIEPLEDHQLVDLVRFFTLAEEHWAGWDGQQKNPVVWLCKELKRRGRFPDAELTHWIKAHTRNRFLPYGDPLA